MSETQTSYKITGTYINNYTVNFNSSIKEFFTLYDNGNIKPVSGLGSKIFLKTDSGGYKLSVYYKKVSYRDKNGNMITICSNMRNKNSYYITNEFVDGGTVQTEIPNTNAYGIYDVDDDHPEYNTGTVNLYDLIINKINRQNPDFIIELDSEHDNFESISKPERSFIIFKVVYNKPIINKVLITRDDGNNQYLLNFNVSRSDQTTLQITKVDIDGNGTNQDSYNFTTTNDYILFKNSYLHEGRNLITLTFTNGNASTVYTQEFVHYKATVSGLTLVNESKLINNPTTVSWTSKNQAKAEIYLNNKLFTTVSSIKTCIIPKGKMIVGKNTVKVIVYSIADEGVINGSNKVEATSSITLSRIIPTAENLTISTANIDNDSVISWTSTNQSRYEIYQGSNLIKKGTSENSITILAGSFKTGNYNLKVIVYYDSGFDSIKAELSSNQTFVCNLPIIYSIEPSGLTKNIDEQISVVFNVNEFCDRWELSANALKTAGTTDRKIIYGANSFNIGENKLDLTVYYSPTWSNGSVVRSTNKTVYFTGYGKPTAPQLDSNEVYSTATPTITWIDTNNEQNAFEYILLQGETVIEQNTVINTNPQITLGTLTDLTEYKIQVRIKNVYGLWSSWTEKTFSTLFSNIILPDFYLMATDSYVQISISGIQDPSFESVSIYRKDAMHDWLEIADDCDVIETIKDFTCPANVNVDYKLRVFNATGAYKDTDIKTISTSLLNYWLINVENFEDAYRMDFVKTSYIFVRDSITKIYSNSVAPSVFKGNSKYNVINLEVQLPTEKAFEFVKFIESANSCNVFLYKSWKSEKNFVMANLNSMIPQNSQVMTINLTLTQIDFVESKMYSGAGRRKVVYLNGQYALDGSIDLSGYDDNYIFD